MANVGTLSIKFTGDAKQLENTFTRVGIKANVFSTAIVAGLSKASSAAFDFAKSAVQIASENENTLVSFTNLTGSLETAKNLYKDLLEFSSKTPFSSKEIQSGATTLLGFGLSAKQATDAIKDLGAAAAANADTDLKRLVVSFGQIQGANVAMTKDLREFVNNGIPIYQILADNLDVSVSKINEMASAGQLTGDVITKAFRDAAAEGGRFASTLETQSQTLSGLTSTLKDNYAIVLGKIGDTILPALKDAIKAANEAMIDFQAAIDRGALNPFIAGISALIKNMGLLAQSARDGIGPFFGLLNAISAVKQASQGNFSQAWESAKKAAEEYVRPLKSLAALTDNIDTITASYTEELNKLNVATASAGDFMEDYASKGKVVVPVLEEQGQGVENLRKQFETAAIAARDFQASLPQPGIDRVSPIGSASFSADAGAVDISADAEAQAAALSARLQQIEAIEAQAAAQDKLNESIAAAGSVAGIFASKLKDAHQAGATGFRAYASAAVESSKEVIAAQIREGVVIAATKALAKVPFPANIILAGIAGGAAEALFRSLVSKIKIPAFGDGGVVFGPTLALIGEKGPEAIVPLGRGQNNANSVNISGVQYGADTYWQNANVGIVGRLIYGS